MLNTLRTGMSSGASLMIAKLRRKLWVGSCAYHERVKRMALMVIPVNAVVIAARTGFDWLRVLSIVVGTVLAMLVLVPVFHRVHHGRDSAGRCLHKVSESQAAGGDAAKCASAVGGLVVGQRQSRDRLLGDHRRSYWRCGLGLAFDLGFRAAAVGVVRRHPGRDRRCSPQQAPQTRLRKADVCPTALTRCRMHGLLDPIAAANPRTSGKCDAQ